MSLFSLFKRKKRHSFSDVDREKSTEMRQAERDLKHNLRMLEIQNQISAITNNSTGKIEDVFLQMLQTKLMQQGPNSLMSSTPSSAGAPAANNPASRLNEGLINGYLDKIPKKMLKSILTQSDTEILQQVKEKLPGFSDSDYELVLKTAKQRK